MSIGGVFDAITGKTQAGGIARGTQLQTEQIQMGIDELNKGFGETELRFGEAQQLFNPFMQQGGQAFDLQAAYSGALGPDAQAKAFADFKSSPQQAFLQSQGEEAILRNAAATGELGGAKTKQALMEFGQGLASQDFQQQFNNLGGLAQQGLGATGMSAGLTQGLGGLRSNLGTNVATLRSSIGQVQNAGAQAQANAETEGVGNLLGLAFGGTGKDGEGPSPASMALGFLSDSRLKENIEHTGKDEYGINLYLYNYIGSDEKYIGRMAQDVQKVDPDNVFEHESGYLMVSEKYAPKRIH